MCPINKSKANPPTINETHISSILNKTNKNRPNNGSLINSNAHISQIVNRVDCVCYNWLLYDFALTFVSSLEFKMLCHMSLFC